MPTSGAAPRAAEPEGVVTPSGERAPSQASTNPPGPQALAAAPDRGPGARPRTMAEVRPRALLVIADSVVLGAEPVIRKGLSGWQIEFLARPALTIRAATDDVRRRTADLPPAVIVAVGYNSLWERNRRNFTIWAQRFDREAETLLEVLRSRGAKSIVWVTLRELTIDLVPGRNENELSRSWYFPYVNERLRALAPRQADLALADWATAGRQPGITYDFIHLNPRGARLMLDVLRTAMGLAAP